MVTPASGGPATPGTAVGRAGEVGHPDASAAVTPYRLVLWGGSGGNPAKGSLYPVEASAFSEPLFTFALAPDQELPRLNTGDLVEADGPVVKGARPTIRAADVVIRPAAGLVAGAGRGGTRLFAERGGVLGHPAVIGWQPTWRYVRSASLDPVVSWRRTLRSAIWGGRVTLSVLCVTLAVIVAGVIGGRPVPAAPIVVSASSLGASIAAGRLAKRSRHALDTAVRARRQPAQAMRLRLVWTAGHGQGPMAVVSLFPSDDAHGQNPVSHVSVVNVPAGFAPEGYVPCQVIGDPRISPVVVCDGHELWPAEHAHLVPGERRLRFWRPAV